MFSSIQWLFAVHNCSSKGPPTSLMSEFGIKPPTKADWDVAGKPHQLVPYTLKPEMNKYHLAPFFAGKKEEAGGHRTKSTTLHLICSQGKKPFSNVTLTCTLWNCTILLFPQSYSHLHHATTSCDILQPLYCRPWTSGDLTCPFLIYCFLTFWILAWVPPLAISVLYL